MRTAMRVAERFGHFAVVLGLVMAAIGAGFAIGLSGRYELGTEILLAATLTVCVLLPVFSRAWVGRFDPFEPLLIIAGVYLVYFVAGPMLRLTTGDVVLIGRNVRFLYARAFMAVVIGVIAMWFGYHLPLGKSLGGRLRFSKTEGEVDPATLRSLRFFGWGLTAAAVVALILWSQLEGRSLATFFLPGLVTSVEGSGGGTNIAYLFLAIEWFIPAFLILSISGGFPAPPFKWAYFIFVSIAYTSLGFRYRLIIFWVASFMLLYLRRNRRPTAKTLLGGAMVLLMLAGWLGIARSVFKGEGGKQATAAPTFAEVARNSLSDTEVFETFATVLDAVPDRIDYVGAEPYIYVFVQPIPRAVWPDKPFPTFLNKISESIGTSQAETAGAAVPHFGEYYLAFGWPGLVFGMLLFGVICRSLWEWYLADPANLWRQVIFAASNAFLVQAIIRGYTPQIVQEWFFIIFPAVAGMYLARREGRRQQIGPLEPAMHAPMYYTANDATVSAEHAAR